MNGKAILKIFLVALLLLPLKSIFAQTASAEFISSVLPQKLASGEQVKDGVQNVFLKDNRLFVANTWAGIQILDVSDVKNPKELGRYELTKRIRNVYVEGDYAFVSVEIEGVYILDISDPANIHLVSTIITPTNEAFWVIARFPNVYIAEGSQGVEIYNIRQPATPRLAGSFDTQGFAWGLALNGSDLYVADKSKGLVILDVSIPATPKKRGQFLNMKNAKTVQIEDNIAYVANGPDGLWILDISNPEIPSLISKLAVEGYIFHASKTGNTVFLSNEIGQKLEIIDVTDPKNPVKVGEYDTDGKVYYAVKRDVYVYIAADTQTLIVRQNFKPVIAEVGDQTVDENTLLSVIPNAYDPDGDEIFYQVENLPKGAEFDSVSGTLDWTPDYEQSGRYPGVKITVVEKTESRLSSNTTFQITVIHVNRNPVLPEVEDYEVDENSKITFTIPEGSDPDIEDKGLLTYGAQNMPEGATFNPDSRVFSWTPTFEQSGIYTIDFAIMDPEGGVARNASVITVRHIDRKPILEPVADKTVDENQVLTFSISGSDPDAEDQNALSYKAQNLPQGATFDPATATFSWTPTYDQSGVYNNILFIFTAGAMSDSTTMNITVNHVNRAPVLNAIADQTIDENKLLRVSISGSDPDVEDKGKLKYSASNLPVGAAFNTDSLVFHWTPTFEQSGSYNNIEFTVSDPSGLTASQTISITVNHVNRPPVLAAVEPKSVAENQLLSFELVGSDPDAEDANVLVYSAKGLPEGAILQGGTFSWTPTFDQSGEYPVTFVVSDGRLTDSKATTITVNHVNRPPVLDPIAAQVVDENIPLTFTVKGSDPDKEDEGKCILSAANVPVGATFDPASGVFSWTPTFDQSGVYQVDFTNTDPEGLSVQQQVQITVNHVNRTPVFSEQTPQTVDENVPLTYKIIPATDPDAEDAEKITYTVENLPEGAVFNAEIPEITWTPTYDQSGEYTITINVSDGEFTVSQPLKITVNHVNRAPQITEIPNQTIDENSPWTLNVTYSDPDKEDQGKLVLTSENLPEGATFDAANGVFSWTPNYEQSGTYSGIVVSVTDPAGLSDSRSFEIVVNHVNRAPTLEPVAAVSAAENESIQFTLTANDPDAEDAGKLTYSSTNLPAGAQLNAQTGDFTWTPTFLQAGEYSVNFKVSDGAGLTAEQVGQISIKDVNHTPVLNDISKNSVNENESISFTVEGTDEDTDNSLTFSAENLPDGASFNKDSKTFNWTPAYNQAGDYTIEFKLTDGVETVSKSAEISVKNVNRPPTISGPSSEEVEAGSSLNIRYEGDDPDGDDLTFEGGNLPSGADLDASSGTFNWSTSENQAGTYTIIIKVSDGQSDASTRTTITVKEKPQPVQTPADTTGN